MTEKRSPSKLIWILTVIAVASLVGCAGKPTPPSDLFLSQPEAKVQDAQAAVTGQVVRGTQIWVNGEETTVDRDGRFTATVGLAWGSNPILVTAEYAQGRGLPIRQSHTLFVERHTAKADEVGNVYLSSVSVEKVEALGEEPFVTQASGKFYVVTLEVENRGSSTVKMPLLDGFTMEDEVDGKHYSPSAEGAFARGWDTDPGYLPGKEIAPGEKTTGWLVFDVSSKVQNLILHAHGFGGAWYARLKLNLVSGGINA